MAETTPTATKEAAKIPSAVVKRIMLEAGCQRVSADAVAELGKLLVERGHEVAKQAQAAAEHAKRSTVKAEDVALAAKGQ
jgi:DNA-binding protein